jgi:hypothetical protein
MVLSGKGLATLPTSDSGQDIDVLCRRCADWRSGTRGIDFPTQRAQSRGHRKETTSAQKATTDHDRRSNPSASSATTRRRKGFRLQAAQAKVLAEDYRTGFEDFPEVCGGIHDRIRRPLAPTVRRSWTMAEVTGPGPRSDTRSLSVPRWRRSAGRAGVRQTTVM